MRHTAYYALTLILMATMSYAYDAAILRFHVLCRYAMSHDAFRHADAADDVAISPPSCRHLFR